MEARVLGQEELYANTVAWRLPLRAGEANWQSH